MPLLSHKVVQRPYLPVAMEGIPFEASILKVASAKVGDQFLGDVSEKIVGKVETLQSVQFVQQ